MDFGDGLLRKILESGHMKPQPPPGFPFPPSRPPPNSFYGTHETPPHMNTPLQTAMNMGISMGMGMGMSPLPHISTSSLVLDSARDELVSASKMTPKEILEAKALAASKSHSEAERRRRERINSHLATLRTLLPSSTKTDKASLLADVIGQLKLLKRQVSEVYELGVMPMDVDELKVEKDMASSTEVKCLIKATLCCEDRPDLMPDLIHAFDSLGLRALKAEISTLGGRSRNVVYLTVKEDALEQDEDGPSVDSVQEVLRQVVERPRGSDALPGTSNKRPRLGPL